MFRDIAASNPATLHHVGMISISFHLVTELRMEGSKWSALHKSGLESVQEMGNRHEVGTFGQDSIKSSFPSMIDSDSLTLTVS